MDLDDAEEIILTGGEDEEEEKPSIEQVLPPLYGAVKPSQTVTKNFRRVRIPQNRRTPLRKQWADIYGPIVQHLQLQIRYNTKLHAIELKSSEFTEEISSLQKAVDFINAFVLGFAVEDALAILRLDDLYIDSFRVEDIRMWHGDSLSRAIGRISGRDGRAKFTIENSTRTRIVLAGRAVHILGSFTNIKLARDAICDLVLGSPINKVYARLQSLSTRINSF